MIEKSNSTSLALATIAILGQPPSNDNYRLCRNASTICMREAFQAG
jgi:hypothetical protein